MSEEPEYELVMPFLPVQSRGGPYDDESYVAGYEIGQIDAILDRSHPSTDLHFTVLRANLDQLDLVAMRRGFTLKQEPCDWTDEETRATYAFIGFYRV